MGTVRFFRHSTQVFHYHVPTEFVLLAVVEFVVLVLSLHLALSLRFFGGSGSPQFELFWPRTLLFALVMQLSMVGFGLYQRQAGRFLDEMILRIASGLLLGMIPLGISYYFAPTFFLGRGVLILAVVISFVFITIIRLFFRRLVKERNMWARILVLGAGKKADLIREVIATGGLEGLNFIGFVPMSGDQKSEGHDDEIDIDGPLVGFVEQQDIDEIVLAVDDRRSAELPAKDLLDCKMSGIDILDLVTFCERRIGKIRLDMLNPSWLYLSDGFQESMFRRISKRLMDIVIVLLFLPVVLPLVLLVSLAIFIESRGKGHVLYSQVRVKQGNQPFKIYKFRSMVTDAEKDGVARWASKNDSRITRVGSVIRKVRLDELPQLYNVLKGDMSFVGPRPERPEFVAKLAEKIPYYEERHRVKPGITGWAQIRYSYGASEEDGLEKLQYDLYYVKNYSFFLDLLIILQTAEVVLLSKGAQ